MTKRCVIVGGAPIACPEIVKEYFRSDDFFIYCDCGLAHAERLGRAADLIVGDFDSHACPHSNVETVVLPREKDDTDTEFAVKEALRRGFVDFLLVGVIGARLDHTLGNVALLLMLDSAAARAMIVDDYSEMEIVSRAPAEIDGRFAYFSLLPVAGAAGKVSVSGAKFPLRNADLSCEHALGVSNEVLPGRTARVSVGEGRLLLIRVRG